MAAVLRSTDGAFALEKITVGPIRSDEVLVEIVAAGICHTDLAVRAQRRSVPLPAILGHEGAGIVRQVGSDVRTVVAGDHVVLTYMSCGSCENCKAGQSACCGQLGRLCFANARPDGSHAVLPLEAGVLSDRFFGQSSFATMAVASERNTVRVPRNLPLEILAPLGCGVMTGAGAVWNALHVGADSKLIVFGAGGVGLSGILAAKAVGTKTIVAVDRNSERLSLALELGASHVIDATTAQDIPAIVHEITASGATHALDTTGVASVALDAFRSLGQRGSLAIAATLSPTQELAIPQLELMTGCKRIIGVIEGSGCAQEMIPKMIGLYRRGKFPFDRLITLYDFECINDAIEACETGTSIKPVLRMGTNAI